MRTTTLLQLIAVSVMASGGAIAAADQEFTIGQAWLNHGVGGAESTCDQYVGLPSSGPVSWSGEFCCPDQEGGCATSWCTDIPRGQGGGSAGASAGGATYSLWAQCGPVCSSSNVQAKMVARSDITFDDVTFISDTNEVISVSLRLRINAQLMNAGLNLLSYHSPYSGQSSISSQNPPPGYADDADFIVTLPPRSVPTNTPTSWMILTLLQTAAPGSQWSPSSSNASAYVSFPPSGVGPAGFEPVFIVPEGVTVMSAQAGIQDNAWSPPAAPCATDFDNDGLTGASDLATLLSSWGDCSGCAADLTGDDVIDAGDLATLLAAWGPCP